MNGVVLELCTASIVGHCPVEKIDVFCGLKRIGRIRPVIDIRVNTLKSLQARKKIVVNRVRMNWTVRNPLTGPLDGRNFNGPVFQNLVSPRLPGSIERENMI